jgi:hypothetical protein
MTLLAALVSFPPVFAYLGTIGKDSLMAASLIATVGLVYLYSETCRNSVLGLALGTSFLGFPYVRMPYLLCYRS